MTTHDRTLPDLEDLAAFIDGRLDADRRRAVEQRLVWDEDYYEDYVASLQTLDEIEPSAEIPATQMRRWLPFSGVIAALLILGFSWRLSMLPESPVEALRAETIVASTEWDRPGWTPSRSLTALPPGVSVAQVVFRLGARTVDLDVALQAGHRDAAALASSRLELLSDHLELYQRRDFRALTDEVELPTSRLESLLVRAREVSNGLPASLGLVTSDVRPFAWGRWLQASRMAALSHDAKVLEELVANAPDLPQSADSARRLHELESALRHLDETDGFIQVVEILDAMALHLGG